MSFKIKREKHKMHIQIIKLRKTEDFHFFIFVHWPTNIKVQISMYLQLNTSVGILAKFLYYQMSSKPASWILHGFGRMRSLRWLDVHTNKDARPEARKQINSERTIYASFSLIFFSFNTTGLPSWFHCHWLHINLIYTDKFCDAFYLAMTYTCQTCSLTLEELGKHLSQTRHKKVKYDPLDEVVECEECGNDNIHLIHLLRFGLSDMALLCSDCIKGPHESALAEYTLNNGKVATVLYFQRYRM